MIAVNLAQHGTASQKTTYSHNGIAYGANLAVQGPANNNWEDGCSSTKVDTTPWWGADLDSHRCKVLNNGLNVVCVVVSLGGDYNGVYEFADGLGLSSQLYCKFPVSLSTSTFYEDGLGLFLRQNCKYHVGSSFELNEDALGLFPRPNYRNPIVGIHKVVCSNTTGSWADGTMLYNAEYVNEDIDVFAICKYIIYIPPILSENTKIDICEIEIGACAVGKFGGECLRDCSSNCLPSPCDHVTGQCKAGCKKGWKGFNCTEACEAWHFGTNCNKMCNCKEKPCNIFTGECADGDCQRGWKDNQESPSGSGPAIGGGISGVIIVIVIVVLAVIFYRRRSASPQDTYLNDSESLKRSEGNTYFSPKKNTLRDFWHMIWQEKVCKIVMVTKLEEERRQERKIHHFHFTQWPDHGVPDSIKLVKFYRKVRCEKHDTSGPMVVHCSAGVGRTGTFIAVDALYEHGKKVGYVDIMEYVQMMRKDRMNMIQTHRLRTLRPSYSSDQFTAASSKENKSKNSTTVLAHDRYRPYLMSYGKTRSDYINTVIIPKNKEQIPINVFTADDWTISNAPPSPEYMLDLLQRVQNCWETEKVPITVVCSDGCSKSGLFVALRLVLEKMQKDEEIDIFQVVREIQTRRPEFLAEFDQYEYCYKCIKELLDGDSRDSLYANI
ncbi:PTPRK [Mytilus coruscus]|uniref:PTPRK n=1 Tax=Mytilus coruscus TaxID=42192 RepID=A0A6J8EN60_MYTCO|nr:PTPRK [Mytilus coruscus]